MQEIWKDIRGYEGLYQVSNYGRIKRTLKTKPEGRILKPLIGKDGYLQINLSKNNSTKTQRVHRLVAIAFIENPNDYPIVNHKDENVKNNRAENLEWCDVKYNTNYNNATQRRGRSQRKSILQITLDGRLVREWSGRVEIVETLGYNGGNISSCCLNYPHCVSAYGYKWKYKN